MSPKKTNISEKLKTYLEVIGGSIAVFAIAFGFGYWKCSIDRRLYAMEVAQRHNEEIANLKIEHNRQLMETKEELNNKVLQLQTEIQFLKARMYEK